MQVSDEDILTSLMQCTELLQGTDAAWTAMVCACRGGDEQWRLALLKAGAAVDAAANNGFTALMLSAQNGHEQCALELLKAKADPL